MVPWYTAASALAPDAAPAVPLPSSGLRSSAIAANKRKGPGRDVPDDFKSTESRLSDKAIAFSKFIGTRVTQARSQVSSQVKRARSYYLQQRSGSSDGLLLGAAGAAAVWFGLAWYQGKEAKRPDERKRTLADVPLTKPEVDEVRRNLLQELDQLKAHEQRLVEAGLDDGGETAEDFAKPSLEDYDRLLQEAVQKTAEALAPKIVKGQALRSLAEGRVAGFATRAQAFLMNEVNEAAGEVCEILDVPEAMLLLDKGSGAFDKMPGVSVILAGILSPFVLQTMLMLHATQLVAVLLPYCCLVTWALYTDLGTVCPAIPTLKLWIAVQVILNYVLIGSRAWLLLTIYRGQQKLQKRIKEMKEDMLMKQNASQGLSGLKELMKGHFAVVRQGLVVEDSIQTSPARHLVGACTLAWTVATLWTLTLVLGWATVPGEVNYSPAMYQLSPESFCGAWATVLTARVSALVAVLIVISNFGTVFHWLVDLARHDDSFVGSVIDHAKTFDENHMGLPVAQLLARAFLLRDTKDMTFTRLALASDQKSRLEKEVSAAEKSLQALQAELQSQEHVVSCLEQEADEFGDHAAGSRAQVPGSKLRVPNFEDSESFLRSLQERGREAIESTHARVSNLEIRTDQFESMVQRINEGAEQLRNTQAYQSAVEAAREAGEKLRSSQAYQSAMEVTGKAAEQLQQAASQTTEQFLQKPAGEDMDKKADLQEDLPATAAQESVLQTEVLQKADKAAEEREYESAEEDEDEELPASNKPQFAGGNEFHRPRRSAVKRSS
eukprot:TRINITY_DN47203_c0_g1_i1.p1 TRINITY_DN47203_c0_g1~~TRINITY_DN47203_c0_g1_i1.p1  ORF type:complete len:779 (+),score=194.43 TRINITY_DN47203_c0_g1_i1:71-2407(+)